MKKTLWTRDELLILFATQPEPTADAVLAMQVRLQELERQVHQTSRNSHKPPSTDVFDKPEPKSLRKPSGKPSGGQPGHPGARLEMRETPDQVVTHRPEHCGHCGESLPTPADPTAYERRQVFDLVAQIVVTEHRVLTAHCPACGEDTTAPFPSTVPAPVQYGPGVHAFLSYGSTYQLLPADRLCEMLEDLTGHHVSQGTLFHTQDTLYDQLTEYEADVKRQLLASPVVHFDESGMRVAKKLQWLHVASNKQWTLYTAHAKRGTDAMQTMGILPDYQGIAVHDGLSAYRQFTQCDHGLCNQHHERELQAVIDHDHQPWASTLLQHLHTIKSAREDAIAAGREALPADQLAAFTTRYRDIVQQGLAETPRQTAPAGAKKRGRIKQTKTRNLLERLDHHQDAVLRFMHDFRVPYTNNQAEQDIRMMKIHQKISGGFRSQHGAEVFCRIRGYISTLKKQGVSVWEHLRRAHEGHPYRPSPTDR